jgi:hypothetical protein
LPEVSLTAALLGLAVAVLLGVALHGWWSARRATPRQDATAAVPGRQEPALEGQGAEPGTGPSLTDGQAGKGAPAEMADAADTADTAAGPTPGDAPMPRAAARRATVRLDALIDALVPLTLDAPVTGELVLAQLPSTRRAGGKPWHVEGLDTDTGEWELPQPGRRYGELQAGVQLANRSGALNEIEYSEFVQKVQAFAEAVGARAEPPDMLEVVARARELDALAAPLDAQLALTLRANGVAWSVPFVQQVAQRAGFVPGAVPGRFVLPAAQEGAPPLLVLTVQAQAALAAMEAQQGDGPPPPTPGVRECVLLLDLPQSPESAEPYPAWHRAATQLADDLDATAVDDQGRPVTLHAFSTIAQDVAAVYERMQALDLPAGSPAARRLFS